MNDALDFDAAEHRYSRAGVEILGVTSVLKEAGLIDASWYTEESRQRGQAVHAMIHLAADGDLHEPSLDPRLLPYLEAYRRFIGETGFIADLIEHRVESRTYGYAGTLDAAGTIDAAGGTTVVVDYKSGRPERWVGPQLAAYRRALHEQAGYLYRERWAVWLKDDGRYQIFPQRSSDDLRVFLAALTIMNWRRG